MGIRERKVIPKVISCVHGIVFVLFLVYTYTENSFIAGGVMRMQRIYIRNNGPVKNFEMDVEKFNILIGEQAAGKSTKIRIKKYICKIARGGYITYPSMLRKLLEGNVKI